MDILLGFFQNLTPMQWLLLVGGGFLVLPVLRNYLRKAFGPHNVVVPTPVPLNTPNEPVDDDDPPSVTDLVWHWTNLCDACHDAGLPDACEKLLEVFPLLGGVYRPKPTPEPLTPKGHEHDTP